MEFHIACPLELFIDELIHAATGINEAGGDDGQAPTFSSIAGSAEELLGWVEGGWVNTPPIGCDRWRA